MWGGEEGEGRKKVRGEGSMQGRQWPRGDSQVEIARSHYGLGYSAGMTGGEKWLEINLGFITGRVDNHHVPAPSWYTDR